MAVLNHCCGPFYAFHFGVKKIKIKKTEELNIFFQNGLLGISNDIKTKKIMFWNYLMFSIYFMLWTIVKKMYVVHRTAIISFHSEMHVGLGKNNK